MQLILQCFTVQLAMLVASVDVDCGLVCCEHV